MEREELLQQVNESLEVDGKHLSSTLSEETINGELDEALEDISEDEESNKKVVSRLAKRLLRMDGNLHSNVSKEVTAYKNAHPKPAPKQDPKPKDGGAGVDSSDDAYSMLLKRVEAMESAQKQKLAKEAKDATVATVKKGLEAKFKEANIEVNQYILKQTLRDIELPEGDDAEYDEADLIKQMERAYHANLKEAGLDKKSTGNPHKGNFYGGKGKSQLDEMFRRKAEREGWSRKN